MEQQPAASSPTKQSSKAKGKRGAPASTSPRPAQRRKAISAADPSPAAPAAVDVLSAEQGDWTLPGRLHVHHADLTAGSCPCSRHCSLTKSLRHVVSKQFVDSLAARRNTGWEGLARSHICLRCGVMLDHEQTHA